MLEVPLGECVLKPRWRGGIMLEALWRKRVLEARWGGIVLEGCLGNSALDVRLGWTVGRDFCRGVSQDGTGTRLVSGGGQVIVCKVVLVGQEESTYVVTAGSGAGQVIVGHFLVEHGRGGAGVG